MAGNTNLKELLQSMSPKLNKGVYVFTAQKEPITINRKEIVCEFKEAEGTTLVLEKRKADEFNLKYDYVAAWITLTVHSSLNAVGLTAAFATALGENGISCNVIAAFYHDHIFVAINDAEKAMQVLEELAKQA